MIPLLRNMKNSDEGEYKNIDYKRHMKAKSLKLQAYKTLFHCHIIMSKTCDKWYDTIRLFINYWFCANNKLASILWTFMFSLSSCYTTSYRTKQVTTNRSLIHRLRQYRTAYDLRSVSFTHGANVAHHSVLFNKCKHILQPCRHWLQLSSFADNHIGLGNSTIHPKTYVYIVAIGELINNWER